MITQKKTFICTVATILLFFISFSWAASAIEPLTAEKAFKVQTHLNAQNQLVTEWNIAPGYYLYRDKIRFQLESTTSPVKLGKIIYPKGESRYDDIHGSYEVYSGQVIITVPLVGDSKKPVNLNMVYQGCSAAGFCYTPMTKQLNLQLRQGVGELSFLQKTADQNYTEQLLGGHKLSLILLTFLGIGLLLAFTPCVLPMVPILSGIIAGHSRQHLTTFKAFSLSLSYVMGMALTYMVFGIVIALLGSSVQTTLQNPWVIGIFSAFFVMLSLSLFGFYQLKFPNSWQARLMKWDRHFKGGTYSSAFLMGSFSSLIVSPCVTAPLVGVLAYIAQTGNVVIGAGALLALGIGMGMPLLLVGASAGKLLPKSGAWMESMQKIFGILMLGVAVWLLSRVVPQQVTQLLSAMLFVLAALVLGVFKAARSTWNKFLRVIGVILLGSGILLGLSIKFHDVRFISLLQQRIHLVTSHQTNFYVIKSLDELDQRLANAKKQNKPVLLDFYAEWCATCQAVQKNVFDDSEVQQALKNFVLLQIDLTNNTAMDKAILKHYQVIAPPTLLFFNPKGKELLPQRLIGDINKQEFLRHLQAMNLESQES